MKLTLRMLRPDHGGTLNHEKFRWLIQGTPLVRGTFY